MLFNSFDFAIFLPVVFLIYWFVMGKNLRLQNLFLLIASYVFYAWWDWRFLSLIFISSLADFILGIRLHKQINDRKRQLLLCMSIVINIGILGIFKYFNFFTENFARVFALFGINLDIATLSIILPVGISFYTFQTLSYTIDIYRKKIAPTSDIIAFFAFVSFFPQLVAGPIERAENLLPQFKKRTHFDYNKATDGLRQMLWGFFKKIVIADNCAVIVNFIFSDYTRQNGLTLLAGTVFFAFQIYGDFSGYSDIAIGTARLFGFDLMKNFAFPYFSRDIAEFWRRWHISLSTWFRDYVYIPIGGNTGKTWTKIRNVFVIFVISGLWHGAAWKFVIWGALNAVYFIPLMILKHNRKHLNTAAQGKLLPGFREFFQILATFCLTLVAWIFFRADNVTVAFDYLRRIIQAFIMHYLPKPGLFFSTLFRLLHFFSITTVFVVIFIVVEWLQRHNDHALQIEKYRIPKLLRWTIYYALIIIILLFGGNQQEFIYFQF